MRRLNTIRSGICLAASVFAIMPASIAYAESLNDVLALSLIHI